MYGGRIFLGYFLGFFCRFVVMEEKKAHWAMLASMGGRDFLGWLCDCFVENVTNGRIYYKFRGDDREEKWEFEELADMFDRVRVGL